MYDCACGTEVLERGGEVLPVDFVPFKTRAQVREFFGEHAPARPYFQDPFVR
jgi:hypothetical protein